jgi:CubicO group peptidase (beta-lactamase class C family)
MRQMTTPSATTSRRGALAAISGGVALAAVCGGVGRAAQRSDAAQVDAIVERFMRAFEIPGAGVAIVRPGRAPLLRAYGVRTLGQAARVDAHTQFAIASNSKAFLTASLAMLVDQGKLGWDDPVTKHLPEFRMYDPAVTGMMTVRDLLVHRSGLPLGAGDLMQFPPSDRTAEDVLKALPYFRPVTGFRAAYAYDNSLYIVAGLVLQRVSGQGWDAFVAEHIFAPLGMVDAVTNPTLVRGPNHAGRHARLGPPARGLGKLEVVPADETPLIGPPGGINVSLAGIAPWLQVQLARGALPDCRRLWSPAQSAEMWRPQTIISSGPGPTANLPQASVMQGYALGWGVADYRGRRMLSHSGGLSGQITRTTLLPDQGIGFVVFTNSEEAGAVSGLRYALLDHLLGAPAYPWLAKTRATAEAQKAEVIKLTGAGDFPPPPGVASLPLERYGGRYRDPWYGDVVVTRTAAGLAIDFTHSPAFKSALEPFGPDAFRTRFPRGAGEDAVVTFAVRDGAVTGVSMTPLSPIADFSFDFRDLAFTPVQG